MAAPELDIGGARVRERDIGLVGLWHALTFGIYNWFWYYAINRELRDFGEARGDAELAKGNPALSVLAVTVGWLLIVPPFVSWWRCTGRIRRAQRLAGQTELNGWAIGGLYLRRLADPVRLDRDPGPRPGGAEQGLEPVRGRARGPRRDGREPRAG